MLLVEQYHFGFYPKSILKMTDQELINTVKTLNLSVPDDSPHGFAFVKYEFVELITFDGDVILWDSDNDDREWKIDREGNELNEQEDLLLHVLKKYNQYVEENINILNQLKIWWTQNNK